MPFLGYKIVCFRDLVLHEELFLKSLLLSTAWNRWIDAKFRYRDPYPNSFKVSWDESHHCHHWNPKGKIIWSLMTPPAIFFFFRIVLCGTLPHGKRKWEFSLGLMMGIFKWGHKFPSFGSCLLPFTVLGLAPPAWGTLYSTAFRVLNGRQWWKQRQGESRLHSSQLMVPVGKDGLQRPVNGPPRERMIG